MVHFIKEEAGSGKSSASQGTQPVGGLHAPMPSCLPCCCTPLGAREESGERDQCDAAKEQPQVTASWECATAQKGTDKFHAKRGKV